MKLAPSLCKPLSSPVKKKLDQGLGGQLHAAPLKCSYKFQNYTNIFQIGFQNLQINKIIYLFVYGEEFAATMQNLFLTDNKL